MLRRFCSLSWATVNPETVSSSNPHRVQNFVNGQWKDTEKTINFQDPLNGGDFVTVPMTTPAEAEEFLDSMKTCPKSGLHNPLKNVERYLIYGDVCRRVSEELNKPEVFKFFSRLIQRNVPKSDFQCDGELQIAKVFFENFCGDNVRFLASGFNSPGDHLGQQPNSFRFPYGPVLLVAPFNFPLEIPTLQLMGALFMGNKVLFKPDRTVSMCMEQMVRLLLHCGMPPEDMNMLCGPGSVVTPLVESEVFRTIQFTGGCDVAEHLLKVARGKVKIEDAGFDWKILGPDVHDADFVAYVSDQDSYNYGGQKCSAQSIIFAHENWMKAGFVDKIKALAERRSLSNLSLSPLISVTNADIDAHIEKLLKIPGAKVLFGGAPIDEPNNIPDVYGSYKPTAVFVPIDGMLKNFELCTTEIFGPFQVITEWTDINDVILSCERMDQHLTAAVVSNDQHFLNHVLGRTVNGTTYAGIRARTTGAPQNHWFGPSNDPRGAGIGSAEAIKLVWSSHREIIYDYGPIPEGWTTPPSN